MKAVAKVRPEPGIDLLDLQPPPLAPDDVLVRVDAAGICGSDVPSRSPSMRHARSCAR